MTKTRQLRDWWLYFPSLFLIKSATRKKTLNRDILSGAALPLHVRALASGINALSCLILPQHSTRNSPYPGLSALFVTQKVYRLPASRRPQTCLALRAVFSIYICSILQKRGLQTKPASPAQRGNSGNTSTHTQSLLHGEQTAFAPLSLPSALVSALWHS